MNLTTATIDECRDYIAKCKGWSVTEDGIWFRSDWHDPNDVVRCVRAGLLPRCDHPIPATLDGAHDSLPEGCKIYRITQFIGGFSVQLKPAGRKYALAAERGGSIALAIFRASAAAWAQVKGEPADGQ